MRIKMAKKKIYLPKLERGVVLTDLYSARDTAFWAEDVLRLGNTEEKRIIDIAINAIQALPKAEVVA
jgi:predicted RNA-binding protein